MKGTQRAAGIAGAMGMLILILDGKTALSGAGEGIELCIRTVIPSLFPFFVLSNLLVGNLSSGWLRPVGRLLGVPSGAEGILLAGFLGGYPAGAQCLGNAWKEGALTKPQVQRLLAFCSNAGPSFLFGMVGPMFRHRAAPWVLWGIHILSAASVSLCIPKCPVSADSSVRFSKTTVPEALSKAVGTMGLVCGWVVLFRIVIAFLTRWVLWILPVEIQVVICGILELSNGCCMLTQIPSEEMRFVICSGMLSLGGLCVAMQTASVIQGLPLRPYLTGKLMQTAFSLIFSLLVLPSLSGQLRLGLCLTIFLLLLLRKGKNNSSIPGPVGV